MKKVFCLVVIFLLVSLTAEVSAQTVVIKGYGSRQYAVVEEAEDQTKSFVKSLSSNVPSLIVVEGGADNSGDKAGNEEYGSKRAKDMKAYLQIIYPNAKIIDRSLGDKNNSREVRIEVKEYAQTPVAVQPIPAKPTEPSKTTVALHLILLYIGVASVVVFATMIISFRRKKREREEAVAKAKSEIKQEKAQAVLETRWVEADNENGTYSVRVVRMGDGKWYTPFKTLTDSAKLLFRADFQSAKRGVRGCLKDPRYAEQFKSLLDAGVDIKKK